jgi:drug/metabolite transporter (DMT)-like permease
VIAPVALPVGVKLPRIPHHHITTHVALAASLALASALAFAIGTVVQQRAAAQVSDSHARSSRLIVQLARDPRWWASTLGTGLGYGLQALALAFGSLLVVQPLLVTSLLFALPLGARMAHRRLPSSTWIWGAVLAVSLAVFVAAGNPNNGASHASGRHWLLVLVVGLPVIAVCLVAASRASGSIRASLLAIVVGILGGVLAVLTKELVGAIRHGGIELALTTWPLYALLVIGAAGIYVQQLSFQAGALQASLPIITVLEPLIAALLGLTLLHEQLRASGPRLGLLVLAVVAMTIATVTLARGRAHDAEVDPRHQSDVNSVLQ